MNDNTFIPVCFYLPSATATVDGFGLGVTFPTPLTPIDFCNKYPNYWLEKAALTGEDIIVTFVKAYTGITELTINGSTYNGTDYGLIGGRPVRRPNTY